jgi:hypothetical protein
MPGTGAATTTGGCSPANSGHNNTFEITCGVGREQGEKIIRLLNKVIANQIDPDSVSGALEDIKARLPQNTGVLHPGNMPDPHEDPDCHTRPGQIKIILGSNGWVDPPENVVTFAAPSNIAIRRVGAGIAIDAFLAGADGKVIARIIGNKFAVNPNNSFDVQTTRSTLVVHNDRGEKVLDVHFLNPITIRIYAVLHDALGVRYRIDEKGMRVDIAGAGNYHRNCLRGKYAAQTIVFPETQPSIERLP